MLQGKRTSREVPTEYFCTCHNHASPFINTVCCLPIKSFNHNVKQELERRGSDGNHDRRIHSCPSATNPDEHPTYSIR